MLLGHEIKMFLVIHKCVCFIIGENSIMGYIETRKIMNNM